jgi:hypothetical protein
MQCSRKFAMERTLVASLALALAAWAWGAPAAQYRCKRADGKTVYQDQPCPQAAQGTRIGGAGAAPRPAPKAKEDAPVRWEPQSRQDFIAGCAASKANERMSEYKRSMGLRLSPDTQRQWELELAAPCGCVQQIAESRWTYEEYLQQRVHYQRAVMASARHCFK